MEFKFTPTKIEDVVIIDKKKFADERGSLIKEYEFTKFLCENDDFFKEEYISISKYKVLRGLHFQKKPRPQGKLISVIEGEIFDVAVDLRKNSRNFLKYVTNRISSDLNKSIWIPVGFAHGFLTISEKSIVLNRCTNEFDPFLEGGIRWNDSIIDIKWPIFDPIISDKDKGWKFLEISEDFYYY